MYYDYEKKLLLVLKIGAVQSISIEEQDFVNVNSKYSGTYTYSDQKLKYHLTNRETKASRSGIFTISFTDEGQMKVKFNENFKFKIATNKSLIFRQEKTPIPFREDKPTAGSFYKALYPYIFEPEVSYTYPCVISGKCAKGTKVNYSPDQRQLEYVSFDERNNIEDKTNLYIWDYPKSDDKLIGFAIFYDGYNYFPRSKDIYFYRYDAQKKLLFPLDKEAILPLLKKKPQDENSIRDYLISLPSLGAAQSSSNIIDLYFYEDIMNRNKPTQHYKLKWNGKIFTK